MKRGVFPGSFNPVTVAHLAVARAAVEQCGLDRVELTLSRVPLGKAAGSLAELDHRVRLLERLTVDRPWLGVAVRDERLLVDLAAGYDTLVVGADKLAQLLDPGWFDSAAEHHAALTRVPTVAVAPRAGHPLPDRLPAGLRVVVLSTDPAHLEVSATGVRAGHHEWLPAELEDLARASGAWPGLGGAR